MEPSNEQINQWHNDSKNWKWNMFYFNKQDSRLFVDKQNPNLGATINFAHPKAYLFFVAIIAFFGFVVASIILTQK